MRASEIKKMLQNSLVYSGTMKSVLSPLWILLVVMVLLTGIVYVSPDLMFGEALLFSLLLMPFLALVLSSIIAMLCITKFKIKWYVAISSVPLSIFIAFLTVAVVARVPALENSLYSLYESRQFDFIAKGNPYSQASALQTSLPGGFKNLIAVDGSNALTGIYWFVSGADPNLATPGAQPNYLIGFYDAKSYHTSALSVDNIWQIVQTQKHLPNTMRYEHFSGIPTIQNKTYASLNVFSEKRMISFYTSDGKTYVVRLIQNHDSLLISVS